MTTLEIRNPPHTPTPEEHQEERFIDMKEVARLLSVSLSAVQKWREKDTMPFPAYFAGPRNIRFKLSEVMAAISATRHTNLAQAHELKLT